MLAGFLCFGSETMKFLLVVISMFIMTGLVLGEEVQVEKNKYEIYELNLVTDIYIDVYKFINNSKFYYGHNKNNHIINGISITLLIKYNMFPGDFMVFIIGEPETLRPIKVLLGLNMIFEDYLFEFDKLNIVEETDEKIRS